jgi:predicted nucleic acid-binding protein
MEYPLETAKSMSMTMLLDTNIVIEHLRSGILTASPNDVRFAISVITEAELFQFAGISGAEESDIDEFLRITKIYPIDSHIARVAAGLGRTRKNNLPDLLIAATALDYRIPLITRNTRDFKNIPELIIRSTP